MTSETDGISEAISFGREQVRDLRALLSRLEEKVSSAADCRAITEEIRFATDAISQAFDDIARLCVAR